MACYDRPVFLSHACSTNAIVSPATLVPDMLFRVWSKLVCLFFYLPIDTKACFATVFISLRIYFGLASGRTALPLRVSPRLAFRSVRRGHS